MLTISYHTIGCKVNQYETEKIREALEAVGFGTVPFGSRADACVINTCSVTHVADGKSRSAVRRALKANPDAYVVVTGCYSELEPAQVQAIEGVDLVVGNEEKESIPERLAARLAVHDHSALSTQHSALPRVRTRAIVKVQDGCDQFCAYCIVPHARPGKRSRPAEDALAEIRSLAEFGYREIVLTGIRLGSYTDGERRLPDLIRAVAAAEGVERIRLSSIEPWEVDGALLDAMTHPRVCRHLHIPLQSGDDGVLERMGRPYSRARYLDIITRVRERIPGIGITTDVIAGFPGETDPEFENTCRAVEQAGFSRLHVFRYSPRKRTRAAEMPGQVDASTKKARADRLSEMGTLAMRRFAESMVGQVAEVLVERKSPTSPDPSFARRGANSPSPSFVRRGAEPASPQEGGTTVASPLKKGGLRGVDGNHLTGFADNYVEVTFPGDAALVGCVARVRIVGVDQDGRAIGNVE